MKIKVEKGTSLDLAGDIFIGDPCYFFPDSALWLDFCNGMMPGGNYTDTTHNGIATIEMQGIREIKFIYTSTAYGDGVYEVEGSGKFKEFGVDAGMFCAIRVSDLKKLNPGFIPAENGVVIAGFDGMIEVSEGREGWMEGSGTNGFFVQTDDSGKEEDEDWEDWEDEEDEE